MDEYGDLVSPEEMLGIMTDRERPRTSGFDYAGNQEDSGPDGLLRH
jgi:hypothetical protein